MAKKKTEDVSQTYLADMAPRVIPEVEDAADAFTKARKAWQSKHSPMMEAKDELMGLLKEHGLELYEYNRNGVDYVVRLDAKENVTVRVAKKAESNGEA